MFIVLKRKNENKPWQEWKKEERDWIDSRQLSLEDMEDEIKYHQFLQFIFYKQWNDIKKYAEKHHVKILGDIPFYVGLDSADVWQYKNQFLLDENGYPSFVAGVPPDYFSETGQRWGNPIYDWNIMKKSL